MNDTFADCTALPPTDGPLIEMVVRIQEELSKTFEGWSCVTDEERDLRRVRIDAELGYNL